MTGQPLIYADFPDPDIIRVGKKYYMITTTMHMFPGGDLLESEDLVSWRLCSHVFEHPEGTPAQRLQNGTVYGQGMWAATLRHHKGVFHVIFVCNDTHKTYHFTADRAEGPWQQHDIEGFYHDCSLLFDDDDRVYLVSGNREIYLTEMKPDLSAPMPGGIQQVILRDAGADVCPLGYEGAHFYKINGKYVLFFIHWPKAAPGRRTEACFVSDHVTGPYTGGDISDDDMGFFNQGVAQGGIVDDPDGNLYMMLFQDRFACGRVPVLCSFDWVNGFPANIRVGIATCSEAEQKPLFPDDSLKNGAPDPMWQWNHMPDRSKIAFLKDGLQITASPAKDAEHAVNSLTQRTYGPACECRVTVDGSLLRLGDRAGLSALQGCFSSLSLEKKESGYFLSLHSRDDDGWKMRSDEPVREVLTVPCKTDRVRLGARFSLDGPESSVQFGIIENGAFLPLGEAHRLVYRLDHFMGVRAALHCYSTSGETGGEAVFSDFEWV